MPSILVVDDDAMSREMMRSILETQGHEVHEASGGEEALVLLPRVKPHAVLLDILMPDCDGFEVLRRVKREELDYLPPVMVVTGVTDSDLRVRALTSGADDLMRKPFDPEELLARLSILIGVSNHRHALTQQHRALVELQKYREDLLNLIIHDLKNPLTVIAGNLHYLDDIVRRSEESDAIEALEDAFAASANIQRMIGNLLDVGRAEDGRLHLTRAPFDLADLCVAVQHDVARAAAQRGVIVKASVAPMVVDADRDVVRRVLDNLVENAMRYVGPRGVISLRGGPRGNTTRLEVGNSGPSIPLEHRQLIFEKYAQARKRSGSARIDLGLGLYFCRLVLEAHGGSIHVEELPEFPTTFVIELPLAASPA